MITSELEILHESIYVIIHDDLNMLCVYWHIFLKVLSLEPKKVRVNICVDLIDKADEDDNFMKKNVTNET